MGITAWLQIEEPDTTTSTTDDEENRP